MQLSIFSSPNPFKSQERDLSTCLIEAAHYIMALNFMDEFSLLHIAIDPNAQSAKHGFRFVRNGHLKMHPTVYHHLALISISGICAATIDANGLTLVNEERSHFPADPSKLVMTGCEENYANFKRLVSPISRHFLLNTREVQWSTMLSAFDFFVSTGVWESTLFVADLLMNCAEDKLMHAEILDQLKSTENYAALCVAMDRLRVLRYPLSKTTLKVGA